MAMGGFKMIPCDCGGLVGGAMRLLGAGVRCHAATGGMRKMSCDPGNWRACHVTVGGLEGDGMRPWEAEE